VLLSYDPENETISFRHYLITIKPYGVSKRIRKVVDGISKPASSKVLDLGKEKDIADFFLRPRGDNGPEDEGYESATSATSSVGGDDPEVAVELPDDYVGRNNRKGQRRAVKLDEIGPRMEFSLLKMTEGLPGKEGSVIYHKFGWCSSTFQVL
jgi:ribosome biogenesis protein SSF1/2